MFPFFKQRKKRDSEKAWKELSRKLEQLEAAIHELSEQRADYQITIENVNIERPILENLTFRLDQLDVDEVSGSLNLGNNFGVKMDHKPSEKSGSQKPKQPQVKNKQQPSSSKQPTSKRPPDAKTQPAVRPKATSPSGSPREEQTSSGLSFTFHQKPGNE